MVTNATQIGLNLKGNVPVHIIKKPKLRLQTGLDPGVHLMAKSLDFSVPLGSLVF